MNEYDPLPVPLAEPMIGSPYRRWGKRHYAICANCYARIELGGTWWHSHNGRARCYAS